MKLLRNLFFVIMGLVFVGCDDSVSSFYATRSEAEAEKLFERGWLPEIIPPSSHAIEMTNDLNLNISNGEFRYDASEHGAFVSHLNRTPSSDKNEATAYSFEDWIFWIDSEKSSCRFYFRLNHDES